MNGQNDKLFVINRGNISDLKNKHKLLKGIQSTNSNNGIGTLLSEPMYIPLNIHVQWTWFDLLN